MNEPSDENSKELSPPNTAGERPRGWLAFVEDEPVRCAHTAVENMTFGLFIGFCNTVRRFLLFANKNLVFGVG